MSREIKFRGQRIDTKEWVYGYYFKTPLTYEGSEIAAKDGWNFMSDGKVRHCISDRGITYEVISETVGQFIGLKSRTDKEIYEGDLVQEVFTADDESSEPWEVKFNKGRFLIGKDDAFVWAWQVEVCGNIHDNPVKEGI